MKRDDAEEGKIIIIGGCALMLAFLAFIGAVVFIIAAAVKWVVA